MKTIVFDIGNVLVRWQPHLAFVGPLGSHEAAEAFLQRTDFAALNLRADGGERFADLAAEIPDPADRALFAAYPAAYHLTIAEAIEGTWALMDRLRAKGHPIHAITNWSSETWGTGLALHPRLASAFGVTVVSGQERVLKPDPAIFGLLCARAGVAAPDCLFIDDSPKNVAGARAAGMEAIHFTAPEALEAALTERGLL
ncbi:HAD family hydrolase [Frigidibacter oleivorans]|uniref:HAD family hydrolase n=1 Tax=Frigidibacter oleivorans TaxID=2487129 RepID=UPI000F8F6C55|nr:HAD family phosphatase [Frigidibacter oleivorans]